MSWEDNYRAVLAFSDNGYLEIPTDTAKNRKLQEWVDQQVAEQESLRPDQVRRLMDAGVSFGGRSGHWFRSFFELSDYVRRHNRFPSGRAVIARWVEYQRRKYHNGDLSAQRISWLEELGIVWKVDVFAERLKELKEFYKEHGHSNVPWNYEKNPGLGHYVCNTLRAERDRLTPEQVKQLENLDFVWDMREEAWKAHYNELKAHLKKFGAYPTKVTNPRLASWVRAQRKFTQSPERVKRLNEISFAWNPREEHWMERYEDLKAFKARHGHCRVPGEDRKIHRLWDWLHFQKTRRDKLPPHRRKLLDDLGVDWTIQKRSSTEEQMSRLEAYFKKKGHCNISVTEDRVLATWLTGVRRRKDSLEPEMLQRLVEMNIEWSPSSARWNEQFEQLVAFREKHGHCKIPTKWPANPSLPTWVYTQRRRWKELRPDRRKRLAALGLGPIK